MGHSKCIVVCLVCVCVFLMWSSRFLVKMFASDFIPIRWQCSNWSEIWCKKCVLYSVKWNIFIRFNTKSTKQAVYPVLRITSCSEPTSCYGKKLRPLDNVLLVPKVGSGQIVHILHDKRVSVLPVPPFLCGKCISARTHQHKEYFLSNNITLWLIHASSVERNHLSTEVVVWDTTFHPSITPSWVLSPTKFQTSLWKKTDHSFISKKPKAKKCRSGETTVASLQVCSPPEG